MKFIPKRNRHWWYSPVFAAVNFAEASVELLLLGQVSLGWVMDYCAWYAKRQIRKQISGD